MLHGMSDIHARNACNARARRPSAHRPAPLSRRGFLLNAAGGVSFLGVMRLLSEAGLLAQGGRGAGADPQRIFQAAVDAALRAGEEGIQFAVYKDEELVVDVWGGVADATTGRRVDRQTLFNVFSVTKAVTATALHVQAERGLVSYDAPIARYWPEFAAHGKDKATVRDGLSHRTGIPAMPAGVTPEQMADYDWMVDALAAMEPVTNRARPMRTTAIRGAGSSPRSWSAPIRGSGPSASSCTTRSPRRSASRTSGWAFRRRTSRASPG